jgi:hypothetical protein
VILLRVAGARCSGEYPAQGFLYSLEKVQVTWLQQSFDMLQKFFAAIEATRQGSVYFARKNDP